MGGKDPDVGRIGRESSRSGVNGSGESRSRSNESVWNSFLFCFPSVITVLKGSSGLWRSISRPLGDALVPRDGSKTKFPPFMKHLSVI